MIAQALPIPHRRPMLALGLIGTLMLAGCGGGVWIGTCGAGQAD